MPRYSGRFVSISCSPRSLSCSFLREIVLPSNPTVLQTIHCYNRLKNPENPSQQTPMARTVASRMFPLCNMSLLTKNWLLCGISFLGKSNNDFPDGASKKVLQFAGLDLLLQELKVAHNSFSFFETHETSVPIFLCLEQDCLDWLC